MKITRVTASSYTAPKGGYLYIFKHGVGPGTIPNDVKVIKWKDLPNYYTAVWLDRFLTTDELRRYDIPSETDINYYLDRIGYCQKNGDVVPCDEINDFEGVDLDDYVEGCDDVTASTDFDDISIDMWYGDEFEPHKYGADAWFNDMGGSYSGWIYDNNGKKIGDYTAYDSSRNRTYFAVSEKIRSV